MERPGSLSSSCHGRAMSSKWSAQSPMRSPCRPGAWPSLAKAFRKGLTSWPPANRARLRSAGCSASTRFDTYRSKKDESERGARVLVTGEPAKVDSTVRLAEAVALVRDLVNTPAGDLGPAELEQAVRQVAGAGRSGSARHGRQRPRRGLSADRRCRRGRPAERAPRLIELEWGTPGPSARRDHRQGRLLR